MEKIRVFTSFNFAYAPRACLLAKSLKRFETDIEVIALVVDEVDSPESEQAANVILKYFDRIVFANTLGIPNFKQWIFKHNVVEACTAVKPRLLENLFKESSSPVIYMDPDTCCFNEYIRGLLAENPQSILLTPHQLKANDSDQSVKDNELGSTKFGIFNLGFVATTATTEGKAFATWWRKSCEMACYEEVANGIFTDQKWCDLVPALFSDYKVIRDPGLNVASWNLSQRKIYFNEHGAPCIDGSSLKFFHFTKVGSVGNAMIARYAGSNVEAFELLRWYSQELERMSSEFRRAKWTYGFFVDGEPITDQHRIMYRNRNDLLSAFQDPFMSATDSYQAWYVANNRAQV